MTCSSEGTCPSSSRRPFSFLLIAIGQDSWLDLSILWLFIVRWCCGVTVVGAFFFYTLQISPVPSVCIAALRSCHIPFILPSSIFNPPTFVLELRDHPASGLRSDWRSTVKPVSLLSCRHAVGRFSCLILALFEQQKVGSGPFWPPGCLLDFHKLTEEKWRWRSRRLQKITEKTS